MAFCPKCNSLMNVWGKFFFLCPNCSNKVPFKGSDNRKYSIRHPKISIVSNSAVFNAELDSIFGKPFDDSPAISMDFNHQVWLLKAL